jgi:RNA polymerase sigma-70 factor (ECF subfamily)
VKLAVMADSAEFVRLTDPFRRELLAHCYRMLGSVHDAEDLVQETYLRAWRSFDGFEGRSSLRTWLYRIATSACLTAIERRSRRPLPSGLVGPSDEPETPVGPAQPEIAWLQPIPDALLATPPEDPATTVASRGSVRLALVAALQHLPARQRAVLILRDVLAWRAAEVAELLDTTTAAVNSILQRARAQLAQVAPAEDEVVEPTEPDRRALLDRYVAAFENADITALTRLLRDDAVLEMPPLLTWFAGREAVGRFLASQVFGPPGTWRMVLTNANGQPAVASYLRGDGGAYHGHAIQVLTFTAAGIARIDIFLDPSLFATFGLDAILGPGTPHPASRLGA